MRTQTLILIFLLVGIDVLPDNPSDKGSPECDLLKKSNRSTSYPVLKEIGTHEETLLPMGYNYDDLDDYIKKNEFLIVLLKQATELPAVNFSCYGNQVKPSVSDIIAKTAQSIRFLMNNMEYGVHRGEASRIAESIKIALKLDTQIAGIPYVYGQLLRTSTIFIISKKVRRMNSNKGLDVLSECDVQEVVLMLIKKRDEFIEGYKNAFLYESQIDDKHIEEHLNGLLRPGAQMNIGDLVKEYKDLSNRFVQTLDNPTGEDGSKTLKDICMFNKNFTQSVLTPKRWQYLYSKTLLDIDDLICIFESITKRKISSDQITSS